MPQQSYAQISGAPLQGFAPPHLSSLAVAVKDVEIGVGHLRHVPACTMPACRPAACDAQHATSVRACVCVRVRASVCVRPCACVRGPALGETGRGGGRE